MGIEGISVNQLRINTDINFNQINNIQETKKIDSLFQSGKVNPDEEKNKQKRNNLNEETNENNEENNDTDESSENIETIKYDLSDTNKYELKLDENTNNVLIVKKNTNEVLQVFSANILSKLITNIKNDNGILINRKF